MSGRTRITMTLLPEPASVATAREAVDALLAEASPSERFSFALRLVVSELVTNAIVHGSAADEIRVDLRLHRNDVQVTIRNPGVAVDLTKLRRVKRRGGSGLDIVAALSERWGIDTGRRGTTMSARVLRPRTSVQ
jgi:anti-sigma regulatory factor (Ser/Thr protein kinase)